MGGIPCIVGLPTIIYSSSTVGTCLCRASPNIQPIDDHTLSAVCHAAHTGACIVMMSTLKCGLSPMSSGALVDLIVVRTAAPQPQETTHTHTHTHTLQLQTNKQTPT
eukprot:jgi/Chrzof1/3908/Cz13g13010.t1